MSYLGRAHCYNQRQGRRDGAQTRGMGLQLCTLQLLHNNTRVLSGVSLLLRRPMVLALLLLHLQNDFSSWPLKIATSRLERHQQLRGTSDSMTSVA